MKYSQFSEEQIIGILRQSEAGALVIEPLIAAEQHRKDADDAGQGRYRCGFRWRE